MGIHQAPPPVEQYAEVQDYLRRVVDPGRYELAKSIVYNVRKDGTDEDQRRFAGIWSEIRGIASRARSDEQAKREVNEAIDRLLLKNPSFDQFRAFVATTDDPLMR
jgi:hypothetical protein